MEWNIFIYIPLIVNVVFDNLHTELENAALLLCDPKEDDKCDQDPLHGGSVPSRLHSVLPTSLTVAASTRYEIAVQTTPRMVEDRQDPRKCSTSD